MRFWWLPYGLRSRSMALGLTLIRLGAKKPKRGKCSRIPQIHCTHG
jgi:hypothetical protein